MSIFQLPFPNHHYGYRFGQRDELGRFHPGEDYNGEGAGDADEGQPIACIGPGVVSYAEKPHKTTWGNLAYVKHNMKQIFIDAGVPHPDWCPDAVWSQYAHLKEVNVAIGQKVAKGDLIGLLGKTGTSRARPWTAHLHWEVRKQPLGIYYYPNKGLSAAQFHERYFAPEEFVKKVNDWIASNKKTVVETAEHAEMIKYLKDQIKQCNETIVKLLNAIERSKRQLDVSDIARIEDYK